MSGLLRESGELHLAPSRQFKESDDSSSEPAANSICSPLSMILSYLRCVGHQSDAMCCNVVDRRSAGAATAVTFRRHVT